MMDVKSRLYLGPSSKSIKISSKLASTFSESPVRAPQYPWKEKWSLSKTYENFLDLVLFNQLTPNPPLLLWSNIRYWHAIRVRASLLPWTGYRLPLSVQVKALLLMHSQPPRLLRSQGSDKYTFGNSVSFFI